MDHVVREAGGAPAGALVLLHGRGADEHDLAPLLDVLDPERRLVALAPAGPLALPPGGRHWYLVRRVGFPDPPTFRDGLGRLAAFVDGWLAERGVPWERTVLGGFSQGAVMSYAVGLGRGRPSPGGVLAMSGFIPTVEGWEPELATRRGLPVAITHGRADPVIVVDFARAARERLDEAGLAVTYLETDGGHHLEPEVVEELVRWVGARVPARA